MSSLADRNKFPPLPRINPPHCLLPPPPCSPPIGFHDKYCCRCPALYLESENEHNFKNLFSKLPGPETGRGGGWRGRAACLYTHWHCLFLTSEAFHGNSGCISLGEAWDYFWKPKNLRGVTFTFIHVQGPYFYLLKKQKHVSCLTSTSFHVKQNKTCWLVQSTTGQGRGGAPSAARLKHM